MTNQQSHENGSLSDHELHWLEMRARGGFGVIETCATYVSLDGRAWPGQLGIHTDAMVPGLHRLAIALHKQKALGIAQLFHGGLHASSAITGTTLWSASAHEGPGLERVRAARVADLVETIDHFRDAAVRCRVAGLAGVELHAAHGYLFGQFLSRTMNRRRDRWGASLEGRARLLRETLRAVRGAVPDQFVVGVRLSPEDHGNAVGLDLDETLQVARWLCDDGADFIHLSLWDASRNTTKRPDEHPISLFRRVLPPKVVLVAAGGIWTRADADAVLERGATAVAVGRAAIAHPDWVKCVRDPAWQPHRPPLTVAELRDRGLNDRFTTYMRSWNGFVSP